MSEKGKKFELIFRNEEKERRDKKAEQQVLEEASRVLPYSNMITDMDDDSSDDESHGGSDDGSITRSEGVSDWKEDIGNVQTVPV